MKNLLLVALLIICVHPLVFSEGSRELAPNPNTNIMGTITNDVAALNLNHPNYHNFASYDNPNSTSRLHIHITDPNNEAIHLGFSSGTRNVTGMTPQFVDFEYRIIDPNGNVVFGPIQVLQGSGNASTWQMATAGPQPLYPGGYIPQTATSSDLTSAGWSGSGDFYIEFKELALDDRFLINYWDITVFDHSQANPVEKKGRLWSQNWALFAINDFDFPNRPFNGAFYVCAEDPANPDAAFITKVDFNGSGFRPAAFNIAFNSFGVLNSGNIMSDRQSVEDLNSTTPEYEIFLNDPVDLCKTATGGQIEVIGIGRCSAREFCIKYQTSQQGQIDILLDFDGNDGVFTAGTSDRLIVITVDSNEVNKPICLDWDGKDGLGVSVIESPSTKIPIVISYAQGIYHFPIYDAELLTEGLTIESVRPAGAQPLLFYDDSNISAASGSGEPKVQLSGCTLPCHRWTNYTNGAAIGFGNLNTINSWWFSQQIVESFVFELPAYIECNLRGVEAICPGETGVIAFNPVVTPVGSRKPDVLSIQWSGPSILGSRFSDSLKVDGPGVYSARVFWVNSLGDTCTFECDHIVEEKENTSIVVDTLLLRGDTAIIYNEAYSEAGTYQRTIPSNEECDTFLTINVRIIETILHYDFDDCRSFKSDSSHQVYEEFEAKYPNPMSCADVSAEFLRRENPEVNTHSCTPGVLGTPAMCVSSLDDCSFDAGNEKSVVFEVTITPLPDTAAIITGLCFWERSPEMFDWLSGTTGPNNYPTQYGLRVLKNGTEIYREENIPTTTDWTKETFSFIGNRDFATTKTATYRFELLGYCLIGDTSKVAAWDLDELSVFASCISPSSTFPIIGGQVYSLSGQPVSDAYMQLASSANSQKHEWSDLSGNFVFDKNTPSDNYYLSGHKDGNPLNGVSSKDVIFITRHLLGKAPLEGPYNYLAADVNRTNSITVSDIAELRKLILGKKENFDNNTSWRLGLRNQELNESDPWVFEEQANFQLGSKDQMDHHFIGFKVGDVSGDANPSEAISQKLRSADNIEVGLTHHLLKNGNARIDFTLNSIDFLGCQMALDLSGIELLNVIPGKLDISENDYFLDHNGILRIMWINVVSQDVKDDVIFSLILNATSFEDILSKIHLSNQTLLCEVYQGEEVLERAITLKQSVVDTDTVTSTFFHIYPNPISDLLKIEISNSNSEEIEIQLFDITGRNIYTSKLKKERGLLGIEINRSNLGLSGRQQVLYKVNTSSESFSGLLFTK